MEMNVLADTSDESVMSLAQQQLFFKEASDASYRAKSNLAPDQQVQQALSANLSKLYAFRALPMGVVRLRMIVAREASNPQHVNVLLGPCPYYVFYRRPRSIPASYSTPLVVTR